MGVMKGLGKTSFASCCLSTQPGFDGSDERPWRRSVCLMLLEHSQLHIDQILPSLDWVGSVSSIAQLKLPSKLRDATEP
eukprot:1142033-Pelagomonas_calceolata.AAC.1